jgi:arylsulfatase A-like enzyme
MAEHKESLHHYLAFCSYQDALFGQLLDTLDQRGLLDDTIVIYVSDHGDYMGSHGLWAKGLPAFQEAYHICSVVGYGGISARGRIFDQFVSLADYAPTILELAGISPDREFTGKSLCSFLHGQAPAEWRDTLYTQTNGNELYGIQRAVFDKKYKFVFNGFDYDELYDLEQDPHEQHNIIGQEGTGPIVREMSRRMWQFAYDHQDNVVNPYIMTALADYGPGIIFSED